MLETGPRLSCTATEAAYLASLLGADTLVGFPDPFHGWLAEEVESALVQARDTLARRGLITLQAGGAVVVVSPAARELVHACGFSAASFIVTHTPPTGEGTQHHFHVTRQLAVEQISRPGALLHDLVALADPRAVYGRALSLLGIQDQAAPDVPGAELPEAALTGARRLAAESGARAAHLALLAHGLPPATAEALAVTLARPVANSLLVALMRRPTGWEVDGLGLLAGPDGLWQMQPRVRGEEKRVELTPCPGAAAALALRGVLERALPFAL